MEASCPRCGNRRKVANQAEADKWCHFCKETGKYGLVEPVGDWALDGLCAQTDPDFFYPEWGESWRVPYAKRICEACPVRLQCLTYALEVNEQHGIWGGTTPTERARLLSRRPA